MTINIAESFRQGNILDVMLGIKSKCVMDVRDSNGDTALFHAMCDSLDMTKLILNEGADPDFRDFKGKTSLHCFILKRRDTELLEILKLYDEKEILWYEDKNTIAALWSICIFSKNEDLLEILIKYGTLSTQSYEAKKYIHMSFPNNPIAKDAYINHQINQENADMTIKYWVQSTFSQSDLAPGMRKQSYHGHETVVVDISPTHSVSIKDPETSITFKEMNENSWSMSVELIHYPKAREEILAHLIIPMPLTFPVSYSLHEFKEDLVRAVNNLQ